MAGLLAGLLAGDVAQLLLKRVPFSPELVWELQLNHQRSAVPACPPDESRSASSPVTETAGDGWGSVLPWEGGTVQSRATQHILFKWLQLFYEAILGFSAACAGLVTAVALQLLFLMASGKQLGLVELGWTLLHGVYSAVVHLGTNLLLSVLIH